MSNSNTINTIKKAHEMSMMYFKRGAVYFDLREVSCEWLHRTLIEEKFDAEGCLGL